VLSEHSLDAVLERVADALADLIPYDTLTIYRAVERERVLIPVLARDQFADEILSTRTFFGQGITGWAAEERQAVHTDQAHLDPRSLPVPGTPDEPEALISIPLISKGSVRGVLNVYRVGDTASFSDEEFDLARSFADAAALALDNAESRAALERMAHTDSLTDLHNHRFFQERLRAELTRASRVHDSVALVMLDIDDFKKVNDVYGHAIGDYILVCLSDMLKEMVRGSDVVCRIGGEEIALIMPSCDAGDAMGFARRLTDRLAQTDFDPVGSVTVSIGIAQGPAHAMNPRELLACAEAAMMTVKARGKDGVLIYEEGSTERPEVTRGTSDVRSIAHLKMLQSLSAKLNRLNEVQQIGTAICNELRTMIDYHVCRVYVRNENYLVPVSVRGESPSYEGETEESLTCKVGEGITGKAVELGKSLLIANALECEYAVTIPGSDEIDESIMAVPLSYGPRVLGVIVVSKLGANQFHEDDVRLIEVLAGHASVALENARLYESQRAEAESAKALLECADTMAKATSPHAIGDETVVAAARLVGSPQSALWVRHEGSGDFRCVASFGYAGDSDAQSIIRNSVAGKDGERLLSGRKLPFVLPADEIGKYFTFSSNYVPQDCAIAPLHGIDGWIAARQSPHGRPAFTEQRLRMLAGISYQTSVAMQKAESHKKQRESAEIANALLRFGRELIAAEGMEETLNSVVEQASMIMGSPTTVLWLQDVKTKEMRAGAAWGFEGAGLDRVMKASFSAEIAAPFAELSEPFALSADQVRDIEGAAPLINSDMFAVAPIRLEGGRLAFLVSGAPALGDYEFSDRKMRLLSGIAHQAALAINSSAGFENLERTFLDTVEALANALEARDEYTSSHARWITDTSLEVGKTLGLDSKSLKRLELAALFHDIGKIGIPNDILQKPGPLTEEEWVIMKMHPEMGARILEPIERLADVRPIVRACHEHFDGSGYPDGKAGMEIPVEARIILVVDAFHAMTTDRPYRDGLPFEETCRRLREAAGGQFDPEVVDALLSLFERHPELAHTD
jgi:diguanylate cyclase (GGDEF)-like protein